MDEEIDGKKIDKCKNRIAPKYKMLICCFCVKFSFYSVITSAASSMHASMIARPKKKK